MSTASDTILLASAWQQCQRHRHHLQHALAALHPLLPLDAAKLATADDELIQDLDQFVLRFSKLQDSMGMRLFPALLLYLQEPYEDRPMLDKLNRLEKLGYLSSVEDWQRVRAIRNQFAHDYPEDDAIKAANLNQAIAAVTVLDAILDKIANVTGLALT